MSSYKSLTALKGLGMTPDEIEKLFGKNLEINFSESLFENNIESYKVSGSLNSNPYQGFDLELYKPLNSIVCQEQIVEEQSNKNFLHGEELHHLTGSNGNRTITINGFTNSDWTYQVDKYVLEQNITSFSIEGVITDTEIENTNTISFYFDSKQILGNKEVILSRCLNRKLAGVNVDSSHHKFLKISFELEEEYLTEEFSERLFKVLRFILNCRKYDLKRISRKDKYIDKLDALNYSDIPNGVYIPVYPNDEDVLSLFSKLKDYMQNKDGEFLERILSYFFTASGLPLEVEGLLYCIVIEEISKKIKDALNIDKNEAYLELLDKFKSVKTAIKKLELGPPFNERFIGAIGRVKDISTKNILMELKNKGMISEEEVNSFNHMRNKLAHNTDDFSKEIEVSYKTVITLKVLVHKMIFILIGYQGSYINYSLPNYPTENIEKNFSAHDKKSAPTNFHGFGG